MSSQTERREESHFGKSHGRFQTESREGLHSGKSLIYVGLRAERKNCTLRKSQNNFGLRAERDDNSCTSGKSRSHFRLRAERSNCSLEGFGNNDTDN